MRIFRYTQARKMFEEGYPKEIRIGMKKIWCKVYEYNVSTELDDKSNQKFTCDCEYHGVQGIPNGQLCSHCLCLQMLLLCGKNKTKYI